jgi:hypothetical protein
MLTIEGWGSLSCAQNVVQKTKEDNQKVGKIGQIISQTFTLKLKHDKIWALWT